MMNRAHPEEFIVIIYDRFKKLDENEFAKSLEPIIKACRKVKIERIYLIDSREREHLEKIVKILKNIPHDEEGKSSSKT